jgi:O-antigen/teichoic acid export membrane protein
VALGRPRLVLFDGIIGATINVSLNVLLIPVWGIKGAAVASASSMLVMNVLKSLQIYYLARVHPFSYSYLRSVLLFILGGVVTYPLFAWILNGRYWFVLLLYPIYLALVMFLSLAGRCLEREDVMLVSIVLNRLRINPERVRRFLERFVVGNI